MPLEDQDKYRDLLEKFSQLSSIKDPVHKKYALMKAAEESDLSKDSFLEVFKLFEIKQKEKLWLDRWYLKPWALIERRIELLAKSLKELDIFIVFQQLGNITVVFAAVSFIFNTLPDRDKEIERAWETIESGKAGRKTIQLTLNKLIKYEESLKSINLSGEFLEGVDLEEVELQGAIFSRAILTKAKLRGANLSGADTKGVILEGARFCNTIIPDRSINNRDCK